MSVTCTTSTYITSAACYTLPNINPKVRQALLLYAMAIELNNATGPNYTSSLSTTMLTDAAQFQCGITRDQIEAAKVSVWFAASGDASTLSQRINAVNCLSQAPQDLLDKAELMLLCNILARIAI